LMDSRMLFAELETSGPIPSPGRKSIVFFLFISIKDPRNLFRPI